MPLDSFGPDPSQWLTKKRWPLAALTDAGWTYIRREGDLREELYRSTDDPGETRNLADEPALKPVLERMRDGLRQLTSGPLTPERFNP